MTNQRDNRGGRREGAGRPPDYGEPMTEMKVKIPEHFREAVRELGKGNQSLGVRRLIAKYTDLELSDLDKDKLDR